jgi:putative flippase GtrA
METPAPAPSPSKLHLLLHFPQLLGQGWRFFRENGFGASLSAINSRDAHPFIQFCKYAVCGVGALVMHTVIFQLLLLKVWPELNDVSMDRWTRAKATLTPTFIAFIFANALVYWLNTKWVFTQGRHKPLKEFIFFSMVNLPGAAGGFLGQSALITFLNWPPLLALIGFVIPNVLINFICRKFFIFKK